MDVDDFPQSMSIEDWSSMVIRTACPGKADPRLPLLPPADLQKLTNNLSGEETLRRAADIYANFSGLITRHLKVSRSTRILDFGCGWGRLTRFLPQLTNATNIWGADVDERLIESCKGLLAPMNFVHIISGAPLPFPDERFDVVISNSVFSHLSEASHLFYVGEIARILRPGGLFLGTTLSERCVAPMYEANPDWLTPITGPRKAVEASVANGSFVYGSTGPWRDYGMAFIPNSWTRKNWSPSFDFIEVVEFAQTINVTRRNRGGAVAERAFRENP